MPAHHARPWTRRLLAALCMLASVSAVDGTPVAAQGRRAPEPPPVMRMRRAVDLGLEVRDPAQEQARRVQLALRALDAGE